ncbi:MAG: hypothetical protein FD180_4346 [Planctomycetota bacterium]|nr:MAG: hypothetical protein FD180_4346 [Planctomycetota bacterium]
MRKTSDEFFTEAARKRANVRPLALNDGNGQPLTLSLPEVQKIIGGCWRTIRRLLDAGELSGFKRGGRAGHIRVLTWSVAEYIKRHAL